MTTWAIRKGYTYDPIEIVKETEKSVFYSSTRGGSTRTESAKVFPWRGSETEAKALAQRLNVVRDERWRKQNELKAWFDQEIERIFKSHPDNN